MAMPSFLANATAPDSSNGILARAAHLLGVGGNGNDTNTRVVAIASVSTIVVALVFQRITTPRLDPREPPLLKPNLPVVGHIYNLARYGVDFFSFVRNTPTATNTAGNADEQRIDNGQPIATLPMLNGTIYALWSPHLIQQAYRHKNFTFDELSFSFAGRVFGISEPSIQRLRGDPGDEENGPAAKTMAAIKPAMMGMNLYEMNARALNDVATTLNTIDAQKGLSVENVYLWLRELMTMATAEGLYGRQNPLKERPELNDHLWKFDGNIQPLFLGILPKLLARTAFVNREIVQTALLKFYGTQGDHADDVAAITKVRAHYGREAGLTNDEVAHLECALLFVSTTNTIPTLFWFFVNVFMRPDLVEDLREEVAPLVEITTSAEGNKKAELDISKLEGSCPLLVSCYREVIRLANQGIGNRYVLQDTQLTDDDGQSYLLKKGQFIMWSVKALHRSKAIWGQDADEFLPTRFMPNQPGVSPAQERLRKTAYLPFGGGKHLCPGRNFAFAENLGFMGSLVTGFEVEGLDKGIYEMGSSKMGEAVCKPAKGHEGGSITVKRRSGWEGVEWSFKC